MRLFLSCFAMLVSSAAFSDDVAVTKHQDVVFAHINDQDLKLDLYVPKSTMAPPLVVWIHGGGWRAGSKSKCPLTGLCQEGFAIASISYRFTDTAIFPAQIHDCKAAVRWLRANSDSYGYDAKRIAVAGSSAGGHLALLMGTSGDVPELEGRVGENFDQSSRVQAIIDYYGPSDFVLRGKTQPERAYTDKSGSFALLGGKAGERLDPKKEMLASPVHYVDKGDPPLLVFQGDKDETVLLDQSERIVDGGKQFFSNGNFRHASEFLRKHIPAASALRSTP